jgi:hypothetical protein
LSYEELKNEVTIPKYQRRLVWKDNERKEFIKTLSKGFPFGSILVYKYEKDSGKNNKKLYSIIDGLQRFSTIKKFEGNPGFFWEDESKEKLREKLEKMFDDNWGSRSGNPIREADKFFDKLVNRNDRQDRLGEITKENSLKDFVDEHGLSWDLMGLNNELNEEINNFVDLRDLEIPVIIFTGEPDELATVFENLNRGGKKLSKYQVYAASWNNENIQLKKDKYSNEILEANIDRYNNLETNREVTIEGFDPGNMRDERILNLSEIAYGIGYLSIKHVESLFDIDLTKKNSNNEDIINEIGYGILGIITQTRNSDLSSIKKMKSALDKNLTEVLKGITTVNDDINNVFKKILVKPQKTDNKNKRNSYEVGMSTNFKYLSYFASIWVLRYKLGMSLSHYTDDESNENISKTLLNLPMYYVYDTLAKSWRSSGDSRLNGYYIEDEDTHKTKRNYLHRIDKKQFDAARDSFIAEDMDSPSINFNAITRAIITIHAHLKYEKLFKPAMNYDFEHVVARSLLSSSYKKERVAAGSIGNGVYLESKENIRKRESNLWDDKDNSNNSVKAREMINSILREKNSMHYPDKAEYSKIMDKENKKIKNYNELKKMIKNREKNIFNDIYELLYVSR